MLATPLRAYDQTLRLLARAPTYVVTVVLTLAIGVAPVLIVASMIDGLLYRPLPFADSHRLLRVEQVRLDDGHSGPLSLPTLRDLDRDLTGDAVPVITLTGFENVSVTVDNGTELERVGAALVSADYFQVLGATPHLGRFFVPGEDLFGARRSAVLSHDLWLRSFAGATDIVGRSIDIDAQPHRIVGVLAAGRDMPIATNVWIPYNERLWNTGRFDRRLSVIARLGDGVDVATARQRVAEGAIRLQERFPEEPYELAVSPFKQSLVREQSATLHALLAIMVLVLLAACLNVANLALAHTMSRGRELAVRAACGADPSRLRRRIIKDSIWLTVGGGVLGFGFATLGVVRLNDAIPVDLPLYLEPRIDGRLLLVGVLLLAVVHAIFSLIPATVARDQGMTPHLATGHRASGGARAAWWRRRFCQLQTALAFVVLAVTAMLVQDATRLNRVDPGLDSDDVLSMRLSLPVARYPEPEQTALFYHELRLRLNAHTEIDNVAFLSRLPGDDARSGTSVALSSWEIRQPTAYVSASPDLFATLDIPIVAGRAIDDTDRAGRRPAVIVSRAWTRRYTPDIPSERLLGTAVDVPIISSTGEIVGIAGDVHFEGVARPIEPYIYLASDQFVFRDMALFLKIADLSDATAAELVDLVRDTVASLDPTIPVFGVAPLDQRLDDALFIPRLVQIMVVSLAVIVLGLASLGLFGLVAVIIAEERHGIAVRLALGATPSALRADMFRRTVRDQAVALLGGVLLFALAWPWADELSSTGDGFDPLALGAAVLVLVLSGLAAVWLASHRMTEIDPNAALQRE
ncbi:MAG: ABC transporter permease [Acidobacteriota bacterium]